VGSTDAIDHAFGTTSASALLMPTQNVPKLPANSVQQAEEPLTIDYCSVNASMETGFMSTFTTTQHYAENAPSTDASAVRNAS